MTDALSKVYDAIRDDPAFNGLRDFNRNPFVPGEGVVNPRAFIVGDAPNAIEASRKMVGQGTTGIVLRDLMALAGLNSDPWVHTHGIHANAWLTNLCKYRPVRGAALSLEQVRACKPHLRREWQAVGEPSLIVTLSPAPLVAIIGATATEQLIDETDTFGMPHFHQNMHGVIIEIWPMIPPTYGVNKAIARPLLEAHWKKLGARLAENS